MQFVRTKKLVFFNNKWGVGKTTLAYNAATKFAQAGYKTVLIDLDPQCNLSSLALGRFFLEENLFSDQNIFGVLKGVIQGGSDINTRIPFQQLSENLSILPGSLSLSKYEDLLLTAYNAAAAGQELGYFQTSAISRFLREKGMDEDVDIFIIDVSPSLSVLNRVIFLGTDYFITPLMPDAFSLQGIENLGITFEEWKKHWKNTAKASAMGIASEKVLDGDPLFIGYIINAYGQYAKKPQKSHEDWISQIPGSVKTYLSEKHCRNGLVEKSYKNPLGVMKDYGELTADAQRYNKAIFDLISGTEHTAVQWVKENREQSEKEFNTLSEHILHILSAY